MLLLQRIMRRLFPPPPPIQRYLAAGRIPWSDGYMEYRQAAVVAALESPGLMACFRDGRALPAGYGLGLDERCVEYPWVFSRLKSGPARLLDAGSALNYAELLSRTVWADVRLHVVTLAPEHQAFWDRGVSYLYEDLRHLPIRDATYDQVICVSTLEHIGMDNRDFTGGTHHEALPGDHLAALAELRRVLKPGGDLLLTVPYGSYANLGTQLVFDAALLGGVIDAFAAAGIEEAYFRYSADGWQHSTADACAGCNYVPWVAQPRSARPEVFPAQPDGAAAARAVACLRLVRP